MTGTWRSRGRTGRLALLLVVVLVAGACGSSDDSNGATGGGGTGGSGGGASTPAGDPAPAPETVRIGTCGGFGPFFAPLMAAEGSGRLDQVEADFGTEIEFVTDIQAAQCASTFASGEVDMMAGTLLMNAQLQAQGREVVSIAAGMRGSAAFLFGASRYEEERGDDLTQWSGSRIITSGAGTPLSSMLHLVAEAEGIEDFEEIYLPNYEVYGATLDAGQADAFMGNIVSAVQAIEAGFGYLLLNLNTPEVEEIVGGYPPTGNVAATAEFVGDYPELTQAIVTAIVASMVEMRENIDDADAVAALMPESYEGAQTPSWDITWGLLKEAYRTADGAVSQEVFQSAVENYVQSGALEVDSVDGSLVDNTFVLAAYEELGVEAPDVPAQLESVTVSGG